MRSVECSGERGDGEISRQKKERAVQGEMAVECLEEAPHQTVQSRDGTCQLAGNEQFQKKSAIRSLLAFVGPGFLICIGYIDPGNFESDFQAGSTYSYELIWAVFWSTCGALLIQCLAVKLGVVTGKHLAQHCRAEYSGRVNHFLWIAAEISIIASDVPEVLGTALALNMLFNLPVWSGVLLTGVITLLFLGLQYFGARKLEVIIGILIFAMAVCFFVELGYAKPKAKDVFKGFVPQLTGVGSTALAISFVGSIVMPQNLYLHSALVLNKKISRDDAGIKEANLFCILETAIALFMSFVINLAVVSISAAVCSNPDLSLVDQNKCNQLDLNEASFLLGDVLGKWSSILFGITLIASGQSSTISGTYAGQHVMQGFLNIRVARWARNLVTRSVAIVPSLIGALIGNARGAGSLIIISSIILSFELPFALIPLLKFTSSSRKMGKHKNHILLTLFTWIISILIIIANIYYLGDLFYGWIHSDHGLPRAAVVLIGIIGFGAMLAYVIVLLYLTFRKDTKVTYVAPFETVDAESPIPVQP